MRKYMIILSILSFLLCFSSGALAYLVLAEGGPTGQWFNPARNGEGFFIEIINTGAFSRSVLRCSLSTTTAISCG